MTKAFEILQFQDRLAGRELRDMEQTYKRVIDVLDREGVRWTLVGAHAVNAYAEPRATSDIDLVVDAKKLKRVLAALQTEFGELALDDVGAATRVLNLSLDLIRSDNHPLFTATLDDAEDVGGVRIPPRELLVALKFLAATSPWRRPADRAQDVADLINVYQSADDVSRDAILRYAASIYTGAETELETMLDRIDRGEKISI